MVFYPLSRAAKERVSKRSDAGLSQRSAFIKAMHYRSAFALMPVAELTHPICASLDLPSLPQAVKRAGAVFFTLFLAQQKRGSASEAMLG